MVECGHENLGWYTKANTEKGRHMGKRLQLLELLHPNAQVYNLDQTHSFILANTTAMIKNDCISKHI